MLNELWRSRQLIGGTVVLATILAGTAAFLMPKRFQAATVVSPVSRDTSPLGAVGGLASQLSGIASIAGISLSPKTDDRTEAIATLESSSLVRRFIEQNKLLPVLYASQWNADKGVWKVAPEEQPTLSKATDYFRKQIRSVTENRRNGLVTVEVTWTDSSVAADWANGLVDLANNYLRTKAIMESEKNIEYLRQQAIQTTVVDLQKAIYSLMEAEIRNAMVARGRDEYAVSVVDRAVAPERSVTPRVFLWIATGFAAGLVVSLVFVLSRYSLNAD
jgi:uncharacterized protein involved in exopolysaccharide biosynthesis